MAKRRHRLEKRLRDLVDQSFAEAVERIGEEEFYYIGKHIDSKLRSLEVSTTHWVQELGWVTSGLHKAYVSHTQGLINLPEKSLKLIGAALFYVVNPFDIVPDHTPGQGYVDDEYVVSLCLRQLDKESRCLIEEMMPDRESESHDGSD